MAEEAGGGDEDLDEEGEDEGGCPGGDFVGAYAVHIHIPRS